jgi:hypothetical protein
VSYATNSSYVTFEIGRGQPVLIRSAAHLSGAIPGENNNVEQLRVETSIDGESWDEWLDWGLPNQYATQTHTNLANRMASHVKFTVLEFHDGKTFGHIAELGVMGWTNALPDLSPIITLSGDVTTAADPLAFDVFFDEQTFDRDAAKISLEVDETVNTNAMAIGIERLAHGKHYVVTVSNLTGWGEVRLKLANEFVQDAAGNWSVSATSDAYHVNYVAPVVQSFVRHDPKAMTNNVSILTYRLTFSEPVYGLTQDALTVDATNINAQILGIDGMPGTNVYDITLYAEWSGTGTVAVILAPESVTDALGNTNADGLTSQIYVLETVPAPPPEDVTVTVTIIGSGTAAPDGEFQIQIGGSANILFEADDWHRISALTVNGEPVDDVEGRKTYTLELINVQVDTDVVVTYVELAEIPEPRRLEELFRLDAGDYQSHAFAIDELRIVNGEVIVGVHLIVNGASTARILNGVLNVYGAEKLGDAFDIKLVPEDDAEFDGNGRFEAVFDIPESARFFWVVLEHHP